MVGMTANGSQQIRDTAAVEFFMSTLRPVEPSLNQFHKVFGKVAEMLFDVETVDDLRGSGKQFLGDLPNPGCIVAQDHCALSRSEAPARRFTKYSLREGDRNLIGVQCAALSMAAA
jgi:hypothetical protein